MWQTSIFQAFWELAEFFVKMAPVPTSDPPTTNEPAPIDKVAEAILQYNNMQDYWVGGVTMWTEAVDGVIIHKIDQISANKSSPVVQASAKSAGLDLCYILGSAAIESLLDPQCQNGNLGPTESNPLDNPMGFDMGFCQLKLEYIRAPGIDGTNHTASLAFALDITRAIPYQCQLLNGHIAWANKVISDNTSSVPDPRMSDPLLLAACAYNFGEPEALTIYQSGQFPTHCQKVMDLTTWFSTYLNLPNVFVNIK